MAAKFKVGDHVTLEFGGRPRQRHDHQGSHKEYRLQGIHAPREPDDPQYEIKSDKTDHIAMHKGAALKKKHT